jgi:hypothetical protein
VQDYERAQANRIADAAVAMAELPPVPDSSPVAVAKLSPVADASATLVPDTDLERGHRTRRVLGQKSSLKATTGNKM